MPFDNILNYDVKRVFVLVLPKNAALRSRHKLKVEAFSLSFVSFFLPRNVFDRFQGIEEEIDDRAQVIENFTKVSECLVQNAQPDQKADLSREIAHVNAALNTIVSTTADRRRTLETAEPLAKDYHDNLLMLAEVIAEVENKLKNQRAFGAEPKKIDEEAEEIKVRVVLLNDLIALSCSFLRSQFFLLPAANRKV